MAVASRGRIKVDGELITPRMRDLLDKDYSQAPGVIRFGLIGARGVLVDQTVMVRGSDGTTISWEEAMGTIDLQTDDEMEAMKAEIRRKHMEDKKKSQGKFSREPSTSRTVKENRHRPRRLQE